MTYKNSLKFIIILIIYCLQLTAMNNNQDSSISIENKADQGESMTHIWEQTIKIDKDLAKKLIESQTDLKVFSIDNFAQGFDNIAYLVNNKFIFRFPRREMGVECMMNEISILPYIATKISFPFSYPQYIGKPSDLYPSPFSGYRILDGIPLSDTRPQLIDSAEFAKTLAIWLKELHSIPVLNEHYLEIKGDQSWRLNVKQKVEVTKSRIIDYEHYFIEAGFNKSDLLAVLDKLSKFNFDNVSKNSYVHGDLYSRHILVSSDMQPTGLIDWGDIHIGHPGNDLSVGFTIFSDSALEVFLANYGNVDTQTKEIALLRAFCHSIILLAYCYEQKEETLKNWTILALRQAIEKINFFY